MSGFSFDNITRPDEVELDLPPWMASRQFILVRSITQLRELVDKAIEAGIVAIDTETEGLDLRVYDGRPMHGMAGFSFSFDPMVGYYAPTGHYAPYEHFNLPISQVLEELERLISETETWWYNAGFDHEVLFLAGLPNRLFLDPTVKTTDGPKALWEDWGTAYDLIWSNQKRNRLKDASVHLLDPQVDIKRVAEVLHDLADGEVEPSADELVKWMKSRLVHSVHRHSMAGVVRRFPKLGELLTPIRLKKLFDTITFRMIELSEIFTPEDFLRSGQQLNFAYLSPEGVATQYAASDAIVTLMIGHVMREHPYTTAVLNHHHGFIYRLEKQIIPAMRLMTRHRIQIDRPRLTAYRDKGRLETDALAREIQADMVTALQLKGKAELAAELKGMSLDVFLNQVLHNPAGLSELTYRDIGVPTEGVEKTGSGKQFSTKADQFDQVAEKYGDQYPFVRKISTWRSYDKLVSNPLDMLSDGGSPDALCGVHEEDDEARFPVRSLGAPTGRMSSGGGKKTNNPQQGMTGTNALAIPAGKNPEMPLWVNNIRDGFKAREGYIWVSIDFSGQELRIAANLTREESWVEEFVNGSGDMHSVVARDVFDIPPDEPVPKAKRSKAKNFNFASLYGGGEASYIRTIGAGTMSREEASRRLKDYYVKNPRTKAFHNRQFALAKKEGCIYTSFGRRCPVDDAAIDINAETSHMTSFKSRDAAKAYRRRIKASKRDAINYVIQGCGADILKMAILFVWQACRNRGWVTDERDHRNDLVKFLLPVHDEINFEVHESVLTEAIDVIVRAMLHFQGLKKDWPVKFEVDVTVGPNWKRQVSWEAVKKASQYAPTDKDREKGGYVCWYDGTIMTDDKGAYLPTEFREYIFRVHRLAAEQLGKEPQKLRVGLMADLVEPEPVLTDHETKDAQPQDAQLQDAQLQDAQPQDAQPQDAQPQVIIEGNGKLVLHDRTMNASWYWLRRLQEVLVETEDGVVKLVWTIRKADERERAKFVAQQIGVVRAVSKVAPGSRVELEMRTESGENLLDHLGSVEVDPVLFLTMMHLSGL